KRPKGLLEPFAGGGIIGLTAAFEELAKQVILVELDEDIASVWQTIIYGDFNRLASKIVNFDFNAKNVKVVIERKVSTVSERAFQTIIRNRVSHGGIMAEGSGLI